MRLVAATTDEEMLKAIIGAQILLGVMDYRGFSNMKGFQQFRAACRSGEVRYDDLSYGFVEQTENLLLPDCAKEPLYARAYKYLNMPDVYKRQALLTEEEYKAAMRSTITAYYTEPELIRYMYRALERFGFEGGPDRRILDPGMGTGNFYSVLPEQYQGSKLYGVELDSITGRIAKQLYPEADISVMGYEAVKFEDNSFDVILGNIPSVSYTHL